MKPVGPKLIMEANCRRSSFYLFSRFARDKIKKDTPGHECLFIHVKVKLHHLFK